MAEDCAITIQPTLIPVTHQIYISKPITRLCCALLLALGPGGGALWAQQNLFNIPSGDITPRQGVFYQHQLNLYAPQSLESKSHWVYGLGQGLEVGFNIVNIGLRFDEDEQVLMLEQHWRGKPLGPLLLPTVQYGRKLSPQLHASAGLQLGLNFSYEDDLLRPATMLYSTLLWEPLQQLKLTSGLGVANRYLVGAGSPYLLLLGGEWKVSKRFWFMADWVIGNTPSAVAVVGGLANLGPKVQLCAGWMLPGPWTPAWVQDALVLELNLLLWDVKH